MVRLLNLYKTKGEITCYLCRDFIPKGNLFTEAITQDDYFIKYDKHIHICLRCAVKNADRLDSLRLDRQALQLT